MDLGAIYKYYQRINILTCRRNIEQILQIDFTSFLEFSKTKQQVSPPSMATKLEDWKFKQHLTQYVRFASASPPLRGIRCLRTRRHLNPHGVRARLALHPTSYILPLYAIQFDLLFITKEVQIRKDAFSI
jgi:hypothetical protein